MFEAIIHFCTRLIEVIGVAVILGGIFYATWKFIVEKVQRLEKYNLYRKRFGRSILLGLEFLVAADIINTVAVKPTMQNVSVLGLIVLIRTFLSFSLDVEIYGKLPWRGEEK